MSELENMTLYTNFTKKIANKEGNFENNGE